MDMIGEFAGRLFTDLRPILELALRDWPVTMLILIVLIYGAGRQKRLDRHHL